MERQRRERYQLNVFLRFSELESELGKGPKKIALRKLRKIRSWPSYELDHDVYEEGNRDVPCDGIRIIPSKEVGSGVVVSAAAEKAKDGNIPSSSSRRTASFFSSNASRQILHETGQSRREKRAVREKEYATRRLSEFRQLAAVRKEQVHSSDNQASEAIRHKSRELQGAIVSARRLVERINEVEDTPVRFPSREIPPPPSLLASDKKRSYFGRKGPVGKLPPNYLASRDGPIVPESRKNCLTRYGCLRPEGHKGLCDTSRTCLKSSHLRASCSLSRDHSGGCDLVGWTCPDCGVPHGTKHLTPDCPTRLKRSRRSR